MAYISFLISHVPPAHSFFQKKSILINPTQNLEAVLNCLFEDFSPQRTFQTIQNSFLVQLVFFYAYIIILRLTGKQLFSAHLKKKTRATYRPSSFLVRGMRVELTRRN